MDGAHEMSKRICYLHSLHDEFNEEVFNGKLMPLDMLIQRNPRLDGYYEYKDHAATGKPIRDQLWKAQIVISEHCFEDEDLLQGTVLHEMIHQYQAEILDMATDHGKEFNSFARKMERKYKFSVR